MGWDLGACLEGEETPNRLEKMKNSLAREVEMNSSEGGNIREVYDRLVALLAKDASNREDAKDYALTELAKYLHNLNGVKMTGPCNQYHESLGKRIAEYAGENSNWSLGLGKVAEEIYNQRAQLKKVG